MANDRNHSDPPDDPAAEVVETMRLLAAWRNGGQAPEKLAQGARTQMRDRIANRKALISLVELSGVEPPTS